MDPPPITRLRPAVPPQVAAALERVLAKTPADRFSPAAQFADALRPPAAGVSAVTTAATGGVGRDPVLAGGSFVLVAVVLLAVSYLLASQLGLPGWVFLAAVALLVLGLPMVLATSLAERDRGRGAAPGGLRGRLTWRRTIVAGALGFGGLTLVTVGWAASRVLGIGPAGTLLATGAIEERERIILADFENRTDDPSHGATVTELLRIGLSRSQAVSVLDPAQVGRILQMMARDPAEGVSDSVALVAAEREGLKAVVTGEIIAVGRGYSISGRLVAVTGEVLTAQQVTAPSEDDLVAAVDQLSLALRERFGESLRVIARARPLEQVTTASHAALRVFSQGLQAWNQGDVARSMQLLEEAIGLDSTFAMAHRKLAVILNNQDERRTRAVEAATKAYAFRDRLTERERYLVTAAYHSVVTGDRDQVISAYRTVLDMFPDDTYALNNLGVIYTELGDPKRAADLYAAALATDSTLRLHYSNLASALGQQQEWDSANVVIENFAERFAGNPEVKIARIVNAAYRKDYAEAEVLGTELMDEQKGTVFWEAIAYEWLAQLDAMRGRLAAADRRWGRAFEITAGRELAGQYLTRAARRAVTERLLRDDVQRGREILGEALGRYPLDRVPPLDRPYGHLALAYAAVDQPARGRALLEEYAMTPEADHGGDAELWSEAATGVIELAEGRIEEAIRVLRRVAEENPCRTCAAPWLARAYEQLGQLDSARAMYRRLVDVPSDNIWYDAGHMAQGYVRLGELLEQAGEPALAAEYYGRLLTLLQEADVEMQGLVEQAREALQRLGGEQVTSG